MYVSNVYMYVCNVYMYVCTYLHYVKEVSDTPRYHPHYGAIFTINASIFLKF